MDSTSKSDDKEKQNKRFRNTEDENESTSWWSRVTSAHDGDDDSVAGDKFVESTSSLQYSDDKENQDPKKDDNENTSWWSKLNFF